MSVKSFLKEHPDLQPIPNSKKVRCSVTGHELPSKLDTLQQFVQGKRYKLAKTAKGYDFNRHRPYLVPHRKLSDCLYCQLTRRIITKNPDAVERHVKGKRYQKALSQWDGKQSVDISNSETESQENESQESDILEDEETDSETDGEGEDCTDLYPPELLKQEIEFEVEGEESDEQTTTQNGEHMKNGRSSAKGQHNSRKRKSHIQRKTIKRSKQT